MATLNGTHTVTGAIDGAGIYIKDTVSDSVYEAWGNFPHAMYPPFVEGDIIITNTETSVALTYQLTENDFMDMHSSSLGFYLSASALGLSVISDGMYTVAVTVIITTSIGAEDRVSSTTNVLYGVVQKLLMSTVISTAWKIVYSNKNPYYDNSLKLKSWFDNMKIAQDLGFYSESLRLLKALQKVLV